MNNHGHNIIIVGGGVIGLSIARSLALRGVSDVCLLEKSGLGTEASFAAAGMLAPQAEADSRDPFFDLLCKSRDLYPEFAAALKEESGVDIELDQTGTLYLAFNEHDQIEIDRRHEWQTRAGLPVEKFNSSDARFLEPNIAPNVSGALHFPKDIQVENRRLLNALVNSVAQLNVKLRTGINVEAIRTEKNHVTGVRTSEETLDCRTVVLAAGTWTSLIHPMIKVEPVRGQMVCLNTAPQLTRHVIYSPRGYIVPRQDGRLLAGSTSERAGFVKEVTVEAVTSILRNAIEICPAVTSLPVIDLWAGLRPKAPDGLPVLGPCGEIDGLIYATGHYRNGILLAPITGELIAKTIVENTLQPELAPFNPDRFSSLAVS
jgi:glycine oxidase